MTPSFIEAMLLFLRENVMAKKSSKKQSINKETFRTGRAPTHKDLLDEKVHIFVDDQNLYYGIKNSEKDKGYRIDFGRLLLEITKDTNGKTRPIGSAYIAGVIPDNDSFWKVAEDRGFTVRRGYLGTGNRSKQDDAYLISDLVETVCTVPGPSTVILVAGDADYVPPLIKRSEDVG